MELKNKLEERDQEMQSIRETLDAKREEIQQAMAKQNLAAANIERLKAENQRLINDVRTKHAENMAKREEIQQAMAKQNLAAANMERIKAENQRLIDDMRNKHAEDMARMQREIHAAQNSKKSFWGKVCSFFGF